MTATIDLMVGPQGPWLEREIPVDPLLQEPFEFWSDRLPRKEIADRLLRELGFENRVHENRISEDTYHLVMLMVDQLAIVRFKSRVVIRSVARSVVNGTVDDGDARSMVAHVLAFQAMFDFGWSHEQFNIRGSLREDLAPEISLRYTDLMADRILHLLRRWEKKQWIFNKHGG